MPIFLLDTDAVSYALRGQGQVADRILEHRPSDLSLSSITLAELRYGASVRGSKRIHRQIDTFVNAIQILAFGPEAARAFGEIAHRLTRAGPVGGFDALIAAHAMSAGLTLVTHNLRHFSRVPGLKCEDWV